MLEERAPTGPVWTSGAHDVDQDPPRMPPLADGAAPLVQVSRPKWLASWASAQSAALMVEMLWEEWTRPSLSSL